MQAEVASSAASTASHLATLFMSVRASPSVCGNVRFRQIFETYQNLSCGAYARGAHVHGRARGPSVRRWAGSGSTSGAVAVLYRLGKAELRQDSV
jgi:hypothetical protein